MLTRKFDDFIHHRVASPGWFSLEIFIPHPLETGLREHRSCCVSGGPGQVLRRAEAVLLHVRVKLRYISGFGELNPASVVVDFLLKERRYLAGVMRRAC